ncbi:Flagellar hook-length control protein-like protein [Alloalcanivorax dieselolei B5]|uniref:Flagellar hook-length control protein-like protein n=1 Tax=Alcanivorax dieselolei (strain DSM 16502 / CGMCC 1.3690 / MCCC 1A00001 / B-5) TaxID=930169 RepID=K0CH34_ALCDB|nr:flagellar hook-length control protein FliK [Alloalcanivorax dieselolei]AFT71685.1 Flagellar hook-length control protein-like protein [Alloalcanivorax dieselolei B5]GGJ88788.1 flagellar hook-length control protein [Alloalcanivorax dieselolei]
MDIQSLLTLPGSGLKPATNATPAEGADFATALRLLSQNTALPEQAGLQVSAAATTALAPLTDDALSQALRAPLLGEAKVQQKGLPEHAADSDAGDEPAATTALLAPVVQTAIAAAPAGDNAQSGAESREARMPAVATSPSPVTAESQVIKPENQGPAPSLPQTVAATESADLPRPTVAPSGADTPLLSTPGTERSHTITAPAPASPGTTSAAITTTVGQPGWGQELGLQLAQWQQRGEHRVELHLHPAELGPLSVSLKVDDQGAQAQFFSAHGLVRQALEQALPQLREALAQQGINLGEASVSDQQPGQQQPSRFAQTHDTAGPSSVESEVTEPAAPTARVSMNPGVDLYA